MPKAKAVKKTEGKKPRARKSKTPELLKGFRDILPEQQAYWDAFYFAAHKIATDYSYGRIQLPVLEQTSLFERTAGKESDVVEKEMFSFQDQAGEHVAMRPEATAQIARAYIEHGMVNLPQPVKLWYYESMFRHDKPQKGRYRQFTQFGLEVVGSDEPIIDAQIIIMTVKLMEELGLNVRVKINSIGSLEARKDYTLELVRYFKQFRTQMSEIDKKRLQKNPLRLLDSKEEGMAEWKVDAPQIVDWLDETSQQHFMKLLEYLGEMEINYELDPFLVRGFDYYSSTVFEIVLVDDTGERAQNALAGGGRYDSLIKLLGGRDEVKGAMGMAIGVERVINAMKDAKVELKNARKVDVFFSQLGEAARRKGLKVFEEFRTENVLIAEAFGKGSLKTQLEMADKLGAKYALILGQKEVLDGTIIIRDMDSGAQEIVDMSKVVSKVKKSLGTEK